MKRHISDVKNSRVRQDVPISINDRVILPFREGFILTKLRKSSRKFLNLQYMSWSAFFEIKYMNGLFLQRPDI